MGFINPRGKVALVTKVHPHGKLRSFLHRLISTLLLITPRKVPNLILLSLSLPRQLRFQTVMSNLCLTSIQRTVSSAGATDRHCISVHLWGEGQETLYPKEYVNATCRHWGCTACSCIVVTKTRH